jgi:DNA-binding transcriptional ArsR family regulator
MEPDTDDLLELTDPRQMRALAHPLRLRLLGMLRMDGPATATTLADEVDESPALVSYHLRQLASHGFIHEAADLARDGRERWWRASHRGTTWSHASFMASPEHASAATLLMSEIAERYADAARVWLADSANWSREWIEVSDMSDWLLELNPAQAHRMHDELVSVIERYVAEPAGEGAERVRTIVHVLPNRARPHR